MSEAPRRVRLDDYDCVWTEIADEALPEKGHWFISAAALREAIDRNATAHDIVDAIERLLEGE